MKRAIQMHLEHPVPHRIRQFGDGCFLQDARVVDKHVEMGNILEERSHAVRVRDIAQGERAGGSRRLDLFLEGMDRRTRRQVVDDEMGSLAREGQRNLVAKTTAGAGDQTRLAHERLNVRHASLLG